jgi:CheY-like chemotaxis protein
VLANSGCVVTCARDGEEAWLLLSGNIYDLLITDREMPGMNGLELIARARLQAPSLPIILMSGTAPSVSEAAWGSSKPDAFLPKPFTVAALLAIVNTMVAVK